MKRFIPFFIFIFSSFFILGQKGEVVEANTLAKKEIEQVIQKVFDGMRTGDSSMVSACFYKEVEMFTAYINKKGDSILKKDDYKGFLIAIGTPHDKIWDEKLWDMEIRVDNNLAQVWTKYAFYLGDKFSHCGVDAFHLIQTKDGWKIFHLTDTRQREGCIEP